MLLICTKSSVSGLRARAAAGVSWWEKRPATAKPINTAATTTAATRTSVQILKILHNRSVGQHQTNMSQPKSQAQAAW